MKKIIPFLIIFLVACGSIHAQSYWFGGLARIPGSNFNGSSIVTAATIGGQSFGLNISKITNVNSGQTYSPTDSEDTDIGFSTFQIGAEIGWIKQYFELEGGVDLSLSSTESDLHNLDDTYLGFDLKLGGVLKYDFKPSKSITLTPFLRSGFLFEFVTNDLAIPTNTGTYYNFGGTTYMQPDYAYLEGESIANTFFNYSIGTAFRWKKLTSSISVGKYQIIGGDFDLDLPGGMEMPAPIFMQLKLGVQFERFLLSLGYRAEWYDTTQNLTYQGNPYQVDFEWDGWAFEGSIEYPF